MNLILILLILLFILVILRIFVIEEGFENSGLSQNTINEYNKFKNFYNWFMPAWKKAIISSSVYEIKQEPLQSPDQVSSSNTPKITDNEMNLYIVALANKIGKSLPQLGPLFPETININNIVSITTQIPEDSKEYINALNWINSKMMKSEGDLTSAMRGEPISIPVEKFQNKCDDVSNCLNDPEFLSKLNKAQINNAQQQIIQYEQQIISRINNFFSNKSLNVITPITKQLLSNADEILRKANSGELLNEINIPGGRSKIKYDTSGKKLSDFTDTQRKALEKSGKHWYAIKGLIDQINGTL